jgi:ribosome-associated translation inhibitor RaiA
MVHRYIERRLRFALARFSERIRLVTVRVFDVNGPRGGVDKTCQIVVEVLPSGKVIVEHKEDDLYASIGWATARLGRAVGRELARRREMRRDQVAGSV